MLRARRLLCKPPSGTALSQHAKGPGEEEQIETEKRRPSLRSVEAMLSRSASPLPLAVSVWLRRLQAFIVGDLIDEVFLEQVTE